MPPRLARKWASGPKVPTPPPSMTAAKWPGHPVPTTLLPWRELGDTSLPPHCPSWPDRVAGRHTAAHPIKGTLHRSLPLRLSWVPGQGGQGAPSCPLHLPGTRLRGESLAPRRRHRLASPCITSFGGICSPEAAGIYLRLQASADSSEALLLRSPTFQPPTPDTRTLTLVSPSAVAPNAAPAAAR